MIGFYRVVKLRIGFKNIAVVLLLLDVGSEALVVKAAMVFGPIGVICENFMKQRCLITLRVKTVSKKARYLFLKFYLFILIKSPGRCQGLLKLFWY